MSVPHAAPPAPPKTKLGRLTHAFEDGVVTVVFLVMTLLPVLAIPVRKLFDADIPGSQTIVQHLTLWVGFLGALLTTREGKHLSLSTSELLHGNAKRAAKIFTHTVAAGVTALLSYASVVVVQADSQGTSTLVGGIPEWWSMVVMPAALAFMAIRIAYHAADAWGGRAIALAGVAVAFALGWLFESNPVVLAWPGAILILLALLAGAPIYVAMSGLAMLFFFVDGTPIAAVPTETLRLVISPTLPAIPLLTAAGYILGEGGAAKRLVRLCRAWIGWMPGGMAIMVCLVCALFTAFTGGSGVTILALGGLVLPILLDEKYPEGFSLGLVTASGSLGLLFPPSLPVILYSVVAQIPDLNALFLAGLVPGILMILLVCLYGVWVGVKSKTPRTPFVWKEAASTLWEAKWEIGLPIVIGTVILGGYATIVEAAALACAYAIVVEVFVFRDIKLTELPKTLVNGGVLVGSVLIVLGVALGLTSYLVDASIPETVIGWVKAHIETQFGFLLVLNLMLLVLGSVLEIFSAIVILAPLVAPLGEAYGVDKIHLAIVFLANLELGFLFPPVGLNLFLSSSRFNKPLPQLYRHAFPFLVIMSIAVLLVTYVPAMTTGVLELFGVSPLVQVP
ncbi:TRAP transporter large permease subunit [Myxococcota bacterium]|nr:TRAP transporter large permease subunit [Myxococcota bacterium]